MTVNDPGRRRAPTMALVAGALLFLAIGALCLYIGLDRAEKIISILGAAAGMIGTALLVHQLFQHRAAQQARDVPAFPGAGGIAAGGNVHVGHRVNTGGIVAVGGILATLYLVLGTAGVVTADTPKASLTELVGTWRSAGGELTTIPGAPQLEQDDTVLTVNAAGTFRLTYGITAPGLSQRIRCTGEVAPGEDTFDLLATQAQCGVLTAEIAAGGRFVKVAFGGQGQGAMTLRRS